MKYHCKTSGNIKGQKIVYGPFSKDAKTTKQKSKSTKLAIEPRTPGITVREIDSLLISSTTVQGNIKSVHNAYS